MPTFPGWKTYGASVVAVLFALAGILWPEHAQTLQGIAALFGAAGLGFLRSGAQKAEDMAAASADLADEAGELLRKLHDKLEAMAKQDQPAPPAPSAN